MVLKCLILTVAITAVMFFLPNPSNVASAHTCTPAVNGYGMVVGQQCTAGIPLLNFLVTAYDTQHASEWCWAASAEMIFRFYQHPINQIRIVQTIYGAPINWPASSLSTLNQVVNMTWTDDGGNSFTASTTDVSGSDITSAVSALDSGEPVLVTNITHAMVLTGIQYDVDAAGNAYVQSARIQDPWPAGYMGYPGGSRVMFRSEFLTLRTFWAVSVN